MTAYRRVFVTFPAAVGAAATLLAVSPAQAQNADAPIDITAAPPPSADSVGPAQLRNFSLGGSSNRPSQTAPAATAPVRNTSPAPTQAAPPTTANTETRGPAAQSDSTPARASSAAPVAIQPTARAIDAPANADSELSVPEGTASVATAQPSETTTAPPTLDAVPTLGGANWSSMLPWLAALLAAIGAAALLWWMRRQRESRYNDPGRLAFAGPQPDVDVAPVPRAPQPVPPTPAPAPPAPTPSPPRSDDGMIVSRALQPLLRFDFQPDRLLVNEREVAVQFDIVLYNEGAAPARDVLVEAALFTANANQDAQIGQFFMEPKRKGDRIAAVAPLSRVALKSIVRLPIEEVQRFTVEDRELFVPLVAFNILFRSGSGEGQSSASFLVGRGTSDDAKLAPFLVEAGPKIHSGLSSRNHSSGLAQGGRA